MSFYLGNKEAITLVSLKKAQGIRIKGFKTKKEFKPFVMLKGNITFT